MINEKILMKPQSPLELENTGDPLELISALLNEYGELHITRTETEEHTTDKITIGNQRWSLQSRTDNQVRKAAKVDILALALHEVLTKLAQNTLPQNKEAARDIP